MISISFYMFSKFIYTVFLVIFTFFFFLKNNIQYQFFFFLKKVNIKKIQKKNFIGKLNLFSFFSFLSYFFTFFYFFNFIKLSIFSLVFLISFFFICILLNILDTINSKKTISFDYLIPFFLSTILIFFENCTNLLIIVLLLEICSYIFYLQFFNLLNISKKNNSKTVYTDSILTYFWNNFFSTIFLFCSCILSLILFNTLDLAELNFFNYSKNDFLVFFSFFFIGLNLKLGSSGYHFFKINAYRAFSLPAILNFSFLALIFYLNFIYIISNISIFTYIPFLFITFVMFVYSIIFLATELNSITNILIFLAYSTLLTTCLLLPLIIV